MMNKYLSQSDANRLLDLIQASTFCNSKDELQDIISGLHSLIPFDYAVCGIARLNGTGRIRSYHVVNFSYPAEWLRLYAAKSYHTIDPVMKENFSSFSLQYWRNTFRKHRANRKFLVTAEDFGLKDGYTHGLPIPGKREGSLFSFAAGDHFEPDHRTETFLEYIIPHFTQALSRVFTRQPKAEKKLQLSARELEVLNWLSLGKSSWDISVILKVSERTVIFHVSNIKIKLGAVNRCQAVAIGIDHGLIDLA